MAVDTEGKTTVPDTYPELDYIRLYITPLNPTLLSSILPPAALPLTRNISFHSVQTFPEKNFGFIDLPITEAQNIKILRDH